MKNFLKSFWVQLCIFATIVTTFWVVYAAWNDTVSSWDPLTSANWNGLVSQVESISLPTWMVMPFAGNTCPTWWVAANGALLPLATYPDLYTLLGTTYWWDGISTYGLPDLRGRVPVGVGSGAGLSSYVIGQKTWSESRTLSPANLPSHNHTASATVNASFTPPAWWWTTPNPNGVNFSSDGGSNYTTNATNVTMSAWTVAVTVGNTGWSQSFDIRQPLITLSYCIYVWN